MWPSPGSSPAQQRGQYLSPPGQPAPGLQGYTRPNSADAELQLRVPSLNPSILMLYSF